MKTISEHGRAFLTPEGVNLHLRVAYTSERLAAALIDVVIILTAIKLLDFSCDVLTAGAFGKNSTAVIWTLGFFLLRNFYFAAFEVRPVAATPGKRLLSLRVVSRDGGKLTANAVFTRSLTREIELWMPYSIWQYAGWGTDYTMADIGVALVFLCIPLLTPDRTRVGDLIAGTCVVALPRAIWRRAAQAF
jgi:uncharacterized RDD family membrane protein YckC